MRPLAISRDSAWSHTAWAQALVVDVPLLSDWSGEATRGFDVVRETEVGVVAARAAFLIEDGERIRDAWMLGRELPDIDAVIKAASQ